MSDMPYAAEPPEPFDTPESELPTDECTEELHEQMGGACMHCCARCQKDEHLCSRCGLSLRHDRRNWPAPNTYHTHDAAERENEIVEAHL